jgi:hypothetical protein
MLQCFLELDVCSSDAKAFVCTRVVPKGRGGRPRFGATDRGSLSSCISHWEIGGEEGIRLSNSMQLDEIETAVQEWWYLHCGLTA